MSRRRAVITGLGPITPIGIGKEAFWRGILDETSGIDRIRSFDAGLFRAQCSGEVTGFDPAAFFPPHRLKRLDRYSQFAVASARLAIEDSGLRLDPADPVPNVGVSFGTALGGVSNAEAQHRVYLEKGARCVTKALALQVFGGSAHSNIAIEFGLQGPGTTNSNSCASGNVAIGDAWRMIRDGMADIVIAGAAEAPLSPLTFAAFDNINAMSRALLDPPGLACRPFDEARDGFVMAEGAASLVVEEYEHARRRDAHIYGEITGFSLNNEAYHMTSPHPSGEPLLRAMGVALDTAGVNPADINYINAHASSTELNDSNEARCIEKLFGSPGPNGDHLTVSGTKGATGHPLGAAGAIEAVITLLAMERGVVAPTLHLENPLKDCRLDFVPRNCREQKITCALNNSFGFGGINSCVVLRKV